MSQEKHKTNPN